MSHVTVLTGPLGSVPSGREEKRREEVDLRLAAQRTACLLCGLPQVVRLSASGGSCVTRYFLVKLHGFAVQKEFIRSLSPTTPSRSPFCSSPRSSGCLGLDPGPRHREIPYLQRQGQLLHLAVLPQEPRRHPGTGWGCSNSRMKEEEAGLRGCKEAGIS